MNYEPYGVIGLKVIPPDYKSLQQKRIGTISHSDKEDLVGIPLMFFIPALPSQMDGHSNHHKP